MASLAEERSRNQGEQSYNQTWTSGESWSKHSGEREARDWTGKKSRKVQKQNMGFGEKKGIQRGGRERLLMYC